MKLFPRAFVGALTLVAAGCSATAPVAPSNSDGAPASSATTPAPSAPPATTSPGTTARKNAGVTGTILPKGNQLGKWKARWDGGDRFGGEVTCARDGAALRIDLTYDAGTITLRFAALDEPGEYKGMGASGAVVASGPVNITTIDHEFPVDGKTLKVISFSFAASSTTLDGGGVSALAGDGACAVDGDEPGPGSGASGSLAMPVTDAEAFVEQLLDVVADELDPAKDAFGAPSVWVDAGLPASALKGSSIDASPTSISGFASLDDKNGDFAVYPFAVMDGSGTCAYGFIYTIGSSTTPITAADTPAGGDCTASAAREHFKDNILPG